MIEYDYPLFRPPSEARSLILQVSLGCSHNTCLFCPMYKSKNFHIRPQADIERDIMLLAQESPEKISRVFLADGDAFVLPTEQLVRIVSLLKENFPNLRRISSYASAENLLKKTPKELIRIKEAGLDLLYLGLESGDAEILEIMQKGSTPAENVEGVLKAKAAGFTVSVMIISGLGGTERWKEHAIHSAEIVSEMQPQYLAALTLMVTPEAPLYKKIESGQFTLLNAEEVLAELKLFISHVKGENIVFRSTHASNYVPLRGRLAQESEQLIKTIEQAQNKNNLRPDFLRGL